jgi:hypothetical protein
MTTHHELIDKVPENIYQQKIFAALRVISVYKCVPIWQIKLNSVG